MTKRYPKFVESLKETDPPLYEVVTKNWDLAMAPGELDAKTKVFLAMALDALAEAGEGVQVLANQARALGATEGEIAEVLRIAYLVAGNKTLAATRGANTKQ